MSLLDKNNINAQHRKLIQRSDNISPETTFQRDSLFSVSENTNKRKSKPLKEKQTTIRVSETSANEIRSLAILLDMKNANDVVTSLIDYYEAQFNVDEESELKQIKKIINHK
ncbi:replication and copy control-associated protein [Fructobacillus papyrifericola]|uniref:Replication and copy control-associated protein n=1 Tax=Fructobacillus papyrifericola TaxID=2713172 RepID=A0ABS5QU87_9LACO|nr:replication and copy control-associated protein [Fructobacillus papyrifericola]MBS9336748.1 replication and copy control-associated protein [Fructobacillus papyrifericola]